MRQTVGDHLQAFFTRKLMLILQSVQAGFQSLEPYKNSLLLALVILLIVKRRETKLQGSERSAPSGLGGISPTLKQYSGQNLSRF